MKIVDFEQNITSILGVQKGNIMPSRQMIKNRYSDCFVYVLSGKAEYVFDGKVAIIEPGDIVYLAHHSDYHIHVTDKNYTFIFIDFFFDNPAQQIFENEVYKSEALYALENRFEKFYHLWAVGNFSERVYCKSILYQIYSQLIQSSLAMYISSKNRTTITKTVEYISTHLDETGLTVQALSRKCGISEVHFRRIFHQIYNTSPVKFITNLRLKKAKELLIDNTVRIGDIARQCGFENQYYFSKVFKSETHLTPSEFRAFHHIKP